MNINIKNNHLLSRLNKDKEVDSVNPEKILSIITSLKELNDTAPLKRIISYDFINTFKYLFENNYIDFNTKINFYNSKTLKNDFLVNLLVAASEARATNILGFLLPLAPDHLITDTYQGRYYIIQGMFNLDLSNNQTAINRALNLFSKKNIDSNQILLIIAKTKNVQFIKFFLEHQNIKNIFKNKNFLNKKINLNRTNYLITELINNAKYDYDLTCDKIELLVTEGLNPQLTNLNIWEEKGKKGQFNAIIYSVIRNNLEMTKFLLKYCSFKNYQKNILAINKLNIKNESATFALNYFVKQKIALITPPGALSNKNKL